MPALKKARITDYSSVIDCDKTAAVFYPTLFDFASAQAVDGISSLSNESMEVLSPLFYYNFRLTLPQRPCKTVAGSHLDCRQLGQRKLRRATHRRPPLAL